MFRQQRWHWGLFGLLIGILPLAAFAEKWSTPAQARNELNIGVRFFPVSLNPLLESSGIGLMITAQLFASPLRLDEEGEPQPYLAKSWKVSPDARTVDLELVEGAQFHDGVEITADDVVFSLQALRQHHPSRDLYQALDTVEAVGRYQVRLHLHHPHPALYTMLAAPKSAILPRHIYDNGEPLESHPANQRPVGSGPFRWIASHSPQRLTLLRNKAFFLPGKPHLERLRFHLVQHEEEAILMLQHGQLQMVDFIYASNPNLQQLRDAPSLRLIPSSSTGRVNVLNLLVFNLERGPLQDLRVRRAIALGLDRNHLLQVISQGRDTPTEQLFSAISPLHRPRSATHHYAPEAANQLLDEAGYPRDQRGIRFALTLDYFPQDYVSIAISEVIREDLARTLGISIEINHPANRKEWATRQLQQAFDISYLMVIGYYEPLLNYHRLLHSRKDARPQLFTNRGGYHNPEVDQRLAQAARELDFEQRGRLYAEIEAQLAHDLPLLPLSEIALYRVVHRDLQGVSSDLLTLLQPYDNWYWRSE